MARPLRIEYSGAVYHVTSRGNARQKIYLDDADRELFLEKLSEAKERYGFVVHAYCLMGNHYHLLVETPKPNLSLGMQRINGEYTQAFNRRHRKAGHLFQGRFKAILVEKGSHRASLAAAAGRRTSPTGHAENHSELPGGTLFHHGPARPFRGESQEGVHNCKM